VFKNKVTLVEAEGQKLCVKEYKTRSWRKRLFPFVSEAKRSWIAGRGLEVRGIPTPETVAWVRGRSREFLLTRFTSATQRLHGHIEKVCSHLDPLEAAEKQKAIALELAAFVKKIHALEMRHGDFSEQNILVEETREGRRYYLIDLDTLSFGKTLTQKHRLKNLIQLGHMPENAYILAKARFLKSYLGEAKDAEWRSLFSSINQGVLFRMQKKRRKFKNLGLPDPHPRPSRLKQHW
jgi:tRNA A-37 threonylcarbamoyl transferase component Bud32